MSFWKERDPNPNTTINELMDQYYLRVKYANEHFTTFSARVGDGHGDDLHPVRSPGRNRAVVHFYQPQCLPDMVLLSD